MKKFLIGMVIGFVGTYGMIFPLFSSFTDDDYGSHYVPIFLVTGAIFGGIVGYLEYKHKNSDKQ